MIDDKIILTNLLMLAIMACMAIDYLYRCQTTPKDEMTQSWLCFQTIRGICMAFLMLTYVGLQGCIYYLRQG